jgi:hypothetical protein
MCPRRPTAHHDIFYDEKYIYDIDRTLVEERFFEYAAILVGSE